MGVPVKHTIPTLLFMCTFFCLRPCHGQEVLPDLFQLSGCTHSGGIWYIIPASFTECVNACIRQSNCQSTNYNRFSSLCILRRSDLAPIGSGFCYHLSLKDMQAIQDLNRTGFMESSDPCSVRPCDNQSTCETSSSSLISPSNAITEGFVCRLLYCDNEQLPSVPNAMVRSLDTTKINMSNAYACFAGYTMFGDSRIHCKADGNWSAINFTCYKDCSPKIQRIGATVQGWTGMRFSYNETVFFTCDPGFYSYTPTSMTCESDGTWTPFHCYKYCVQGDIPTLDNGGPAAGTTYNTNQRATYTCNHGYYLSSAKDSIACYDDGSWEAPETKCFEYCDAPSGPDHSVISGTSSSQYTVDMEVKFVCSPTEDYYADREDTSVTCQADGTWTSTEFSCNRYCGQPPLDSTDGWFDGVQYNEIVAGGGKERYTVEDNVKYGCLFGTTLHGSSERKCQADGNWDGAIKCCSQILFTCCTSGQCEGSRHG